MVQELVDADASGIVFTADPVTGDDTMIEINAAWGLGEAIVGGQVTPDTITVERTSGRIMRTVINTKTIMTGLATSGTIVVAGTDGSARRARPDCSSRHQRLVDLAIMVEDLFKDPDGHRMVSQLVINSSSCRPGRSPPQSTLIRGMTAVPAISCGPIPMSVRPFRMS